MRKNDSVTESYSCDHHWGGGGGTPQNRSGVQLETRKNKCSPVFYLALAFVVNTTACLGNKNIKHIQVHQTEPSASIL